MKYNFIPLLEKLSKHLSGDFIIKIEDDKVIVEPKDKTFSSDWYIGVNTECPLYSLKFSVKDSSDTKNLYQVSVYYYHVDYTENPPRLHDASVKITNILLNNDGTGEIIYDRERQWETLRNLVVEKTGIDNSLEFVSSTNYGRV